MRLEIDTEGPLDINAITLAEAPGVGSHVLEYQVEGQVDSDWQFLAQGATIGDHIVARFPKATVWKVRLTILKSQKLAEAETKKSKKDKKREKRGS